MYWKNIESGKQEVVISGPRSISGNIDVPSLDDIVRNKMFADLQYWLNNINDRELTLEELKPYTNKLMEANAAGLRVTDIMDCLTNMLIFRNNSLAKIENQKNLLSYIDLFIEFAHSMDKLADEDNENDKQRIQEDLSRIFFYNIINNILKDNHVLVKDTPKAVKVARTMFGKRIKDYTDPANIAALRNEINNGIEYVRRALKANPQKARYDIEYHIIRTEIVSLDELGLSIKTGGLEVSDRLGGRR